uniref:Solute carrier family 15 member 1 n=1 Tax=Neolamprologus brichardi TaxID=32507 RepID=A0A3Q4I617_NEOBR
LSAVEKIKKPKKRSVTIFGYPLSIFFIVVNEFCERFSYYGMRAVLVLYFKYFLRWDEDFATTIYHTFVALLPHTSLVVMAVSAIQDITDANKDGTPDNMTLHVALSMLGLFLIALGTGGIKPCVAAFGGDQFEDHQEKQRSTFFSIFYLSINAGSLISTLITPILRAQTCGIHIQQECYPLAFGVPAALMVVALIVFIVGSPMYNRNPPQGNIIVKVCKCIGFAVKNRFRHRSSQYPKREHWMDWAEEKYNKLLIAQVKMALKVLFLYIPLPMFWALFDQQGSRWTFQATTMNGNFATSLSSHQTVNPILILILVPVMDTLIYPLISKCFNFTPLRRITVGMFLAALAFVAAALLQIQIDETLPDFPSSTESQVKFINMVNRDLQIEADNETISLKGFGANEDYLTFHNQFTLVLESGQQNTVNLANGTRNTIAIIQGSKLGFEKFDDITSKPEKGENAIRVLNGFGSVLNVTVRDKVFNFTSNMSEYLSVSHGKAEFMIKDNRESCVYTQELGFGSSYTLIIPSTFTFGERCSENIKAVMDMKPNSVHMAWQIIQYFLMTTGEVVFSVTGLEFSYSQAPSNMKSVLQAGWLLTVAVGNIIVLIVAEAATLEDQWAEYILFASLLVLVCITFAIMAYFYTYTDPTKIEAQFDKMEPEEKEKRKNFDMPRKGSAEICRNPPQLHESDRVRSDGCGGEQLLS